MHIRLTNLWKGNSEPSIERTRPVGTLLSPESSSSHLLAVEHDGGEDDDGHGEGEDEEAQLGGARLQRVAEDAQPLRVARKFEDAEHAEHAEGDERPGHLMMVGGFDSPQCSFLSLQ